VFWVNSHVHRFLLLKSNKWTNQHRNQYCILLPALQNESVYDCWSCWIQTKYPNQTGPCENLDVSAKCQFLEVLPRMYKSLMSRVWPCIKWISALLVSLRYHHFSSCMTYEEFILMFRWHELSFIFSHNKLEVDVKALILLFTYSHSLLCH